jgi:hypothetical protein
MKQSWLNLKYYPDIHLEGQEYHENPSHGTWSPGRDLIPGTPEYKAEALPTQLRSLVMFFSTFQPSHTYITSTTRLYEDIRHHCSKVFKDG